MVFLSEDWGLLNTVQGFTMENLEVSIYVEDELAIVLSLGKNTLPKT